MKVLNGNWVTEMIEEIRNGKIESSLQWVFEESEWNEFVNWRRTEDKK